MGYSAVILAGGKGTRMGFREKALMTIKSKPLICYVINALEKAVDDIIISVRDEEEGELIEKVTPGYTFSYDAYENIGPLAGILSGLAKCTTEFCFITACDMPFINEKVVKLLFSRCEYHDAAIPRHEDGFLEPLHAVYESISMKKSTKKAIEFGKTIILAPIAGLNVNYVEMSEIKGIDPALRTFININTPGEMNRILEEI